MTVGVLHSLLRSPGEISAACREDRDTRPIVLTALAAIVLGGAAFGGVIGSFRGGVQIAYAALKVPLALIATLCVCAPAFHALAAGFGRAWPLRSVISLVVAAAGRCSLVLLAFTPALWLVLDCGIGYHSAALAASLAYAVAGLAALGILLRGLGDGPSRAITALAFAGVFFAVGGQTAWILRPYLVRPRTPDVPFLRHREGGFSGALITSGRSAAGVYDRDRPDMPAIDSNIAEPEVLPENEDSPCNGRGDCKERRAP